MVVSRTVVPIVADEARTFGMQTLFRQAGIYSAVGQLYEPEDHEELLYYREAKDGQILEEGITEAGALSSWLPAGTSLLSPWPRNAAVLHLLFGLWLSTRGRPHLGGGRLPLARLSGRRDSGPHDAR